MDGSPPCFSVHGISQARTLKWVAISSSRESSPPRDQNQLACIAGGFFTIWATREEFDYKVWVPKNWCFRTVVLEKTLESPLKNKEIKPVHPKGNQAWILEGLMLKLQYFDHLMWRAKSLEKALMLGKIEGSDRGWDGWMASLTRWTWVWVNSWSWQRSWGRRLGIRKGGIEPQESPWKFSSIHIPYLLLIIFYHNFQIPLLCLNILGKMKLKLLLIS